MKYLLILFLLIFPASNISFSQEHNIPRVKYIFDPAADAKADLKKALSLAEKTHKNTLILVGGDWSNQSEVFDATLKMSDIQMYLDAHYVFLRINFSPDNKNVDVLGPFDYPKYEGYPVIIVLDPTGKKIVAKSCDDYKTDNKLPYSTFKILHALQSWETK